MNRPIRPTSPCQQDCPNRSGECKSVCPLNAEYEKAYAEYDAKLKAFREYTHAALGKSYARQKNDLKYAREKNRKRNNLPSKFSKYARKKHDD